MLLSLQLLLLHLWYGGHGRREGHPRPAGPHVDRGGGVRRLHGLRQTVQEGLRRYYARPYGRHPLARQVRLGHAPGQAYSLAPSEGRRGTGRNCAGRRSSSGRRDGRQRRQISG